MLEQILDEIHDDMTDPVLPYEGEELLEQILGDKIEDLRRKDTIAFAPLWSLMQELMGRNDTKLFGGSIDLGSDIVDAEEAFLILITDLVEAAYRAKYMAAA